MKALAIDDVKRSDIFHVYPEDIKIDHSENNRFASGEIDELIESIKNYGQLEPVGCVRQRPANTLKLAYGFGRLEAIRAINKGLSKDKRMRVKVQVFDGNTEDVFWRNLAENHHRNNLTHMDYAIAIRKMTDNLGMTQTEIAKYFKKSQSWVSQHIGLLSLESKYQMQLHRGELSFTAAMALVSTPAEERPKVMEAAMASTVGTVNPASPFEASQTSVPTVKRRGRPSGTKTQAIMRASGSAKKRSLSDVIEFWQPLIGSNTGCGPKTQALAKLNVAILTGQIEDVKAIMEIQKLMGEER